MIFIKTALGHSTLQNRSIPLTPRQRSAFILFDGKRDSQEVLAATAGLGVTQVDVMHLVTQCLLAPQQAATPMPVTAALVPMRENAGAVAPAALFVTLDGLPTRDAQAHYSTAYPIATRLTASLGLRGFRLNLAVEAAGDLGKLKELAPRIKEAVGAEKFLALHNALYD